MIPKKTAAVVVLSALVPLAVAVPLTFAADRNPPPPQQAPRVLGHLELNSRRITLQSGGLFTVRARDGKVLAENATMAELKAMDPRLQEKLQRIMAGRSAGVAWAGR